MPLALVPQGFEALLVPTDCRMRGINNRTFEMLKNAELYFSKPKGFNDINECKYKMCDPSLYDEIISEIPTGGFGDIRKAGIIAFDKATQQRTHEVSMCCFSLDKDNQLMWGHYANSHKGICLQFETKQTENMPGNVEFRIMENSLNEKENATVKTKSGEVIINSDGGISSDDVISTYAWPVIYTGDVPNNIGKYGNEYRTYYAVKDKMWEYEHEYRISFEGNVLNSPLVRFDKSMLTGIIFGHKTSEDDKRKIRYIIQNEYINYGFEVSFYQAVSTNYSYSLTIQKL